MGVTVNRRTMQAFHGGALTTTAVINGIAAGGLVNGTIDYGYEDILTTPADGTTFPEVDRLTQFVRGNITSQDWVNVLAVITGTVSSYIWYERESGLATVCKNTLLNPVIHQAGITLTHRQHATCNWAFECKAADDDDGFAALFAADTGAVLPAAVTPSTRGLEILALAHGGSLDIYHVQQLQWNLQATLTRGSGDGDVGYTAVDRVWGGQPLGGSITIQELNAAGADAKAAMAILAAAEGDLVATVLTSQGGANKTLTLKNVVFTTSQQNLDSSGAYMSTTINFVQNSPAAERLGLGTDSPMTGDIAAISIA